MQNIEFFRITAEGETLTIENFDQKSDEVYIIVDHESRNIFLWKGAEAGVRLNFIGSRAMTEKRKVVGFHYKTGIEDQGDESKAFKATIGRSGGEITEVATPTSTYVETEAPPDLEAMAREQGIDVDNLEYDDTLTGSPVAGMGAVGNRPQRSILTMLDESGDIDKKGVPPVSKGKDSPKAKVPTKVHPKKFDAKAYTKDRIEKAKEILKELKETKGYSREMVVINNSLFKVQSNNYELEEFDNALEGIFNVNEYTPRLICQSGEVILMELLKPTGEELDTDLTQNLSDLTTMFMIEIDD